MFPSASYVEAQMCWYLEVRPLEGNQVMSVQPHDGISVLVRARRQLGLFPSLSPLYKKTSCL